MKFVAKIFPFIPTKGDTTKLIVGILFYILAPLIAIAVTAIGFTFTVILIPLIAVIEPLLCVYGFVGLLFTIQNKKERDCYYGKRHRYLLRQLWQGIKRGSALLCKLRPFRDAAGPSCRTHPRCARRACD